MFTEEHFHLFQKYDQCESMSLKRRICHQDATVLCFMIIRPVRSKGTYKDEVDEVNASAFHVSALQPTPSYQNHNVDIVQDLPRAPGPSLALTDSKEPTWPTCEKQACRDAGCWWSPLDMPCRCPSKQLKGIEPGLPHGSAVVASFNTATPYNLT